MSIASDIRSYADTAVHQGKQVLDSAQSQLNDVTGQANQFYGKTKDNVTDIAGKATEAVNDLRASAEKAVNLDAVKTAVEPYLAQVKEYTSSVTDRAEVLIAGVKNDKRVAKLVDAAGSVTGVLVETVHERVVKPVQSLTGIGSKPAAKPAPAPNAASTAAAKPATKPAATKPVSKSASTPAARKAPTKRATTS
jgi:uncharacterized protein YjbJ (UPF0337 family)